MSSITTSDVIDQGTLDWVHSIQARHAEFLAGEIARRSNGKPMDPVYRDRIIKAAVEGGIDPIVAAALDGPEINKLTEFDEPEVRKSSATLVNLLTETMTDATMNVGERALLVWSLATGQTNALCASNSWNPAHYHIFVDPDLLVFCNSIGKLVAECLAGNAAVNGDQIDLMTIEANAQSPEIQRRAADLFCSSVLMGTPRASKPWLPSAAAFNYAQQLSFGLSLFPLAHELGHLHLGHVDGPDTRQIAVEHLGNFLLYPHDDEFQADLVGAIVAVETIARIGIQGMFNFLTPYIFIKAIETLDACSEVFGLVGETSATHPSSTERSRNLRAVLSLNSERMKMTPLYNSALRAVDRMFHWFLFVSVMTLKKQQMAGEKPRERLRLTIVERDQQMKAEWQAREGNN